tara:strand:+ start:10531 stop:10980 length:450 start_codon:yes stop_codon:yes gene_type:complete
MLTLLSSLLGFGTSFVPKILDFVQDKSDKAQELKIMALQIEREEKMLAVKAEMMDSANDMQRDVALLQHDTATAKKASTWVHNLRSSVRPVITYLFFVLFFFVEGVAAYVILRDGGDISIIASTLWSEETSSIFAAIVSFWFGSRAIKK